MNSWGSILNLALCATLWGLPHSIDSVTAKVVGNHPAWQHVTHGGQPLTGTLQRVRVEESNHGVDLGGANAWYIQQVIQNSDDAASAEASRSLLKKQSVKSFKHRGLLETGPISSDDMFLIDYGLDAEEDYAAAGAELDAAAPAQPGTTLPPPDECFIDEGEWPDWDGSEARRQSSACQTLRDALYILDCELYNTLESIAPKGSDFELATLLDDMATSVTLLLPDHPGRHQFHTAVASNVITPGEAREVILSHILPEAYTMEDWQAEDADLLFPNVLEGQLSLQFPGQEDYESSISSDTIVLSLDSIPGEDYNSGFEGTATLLQADIDGCGGGSVIHIITSFMTSLRLDLPGDASPDATAPTATAPTDAAPAPTGTGAGRRGVIIGGSAGALVAVAGLTVLCCLCRRRRRDRKALLLPQGGPSRSTVELVRTGPSCMTSHNEVATRGGLHKAPQDNPMGEGADDNNQTATVEIFSTLGVTTSDAQLYVMPEPDEKADSYDRKEYVNWQLDGLMGQEVLGNVVFHEGSDGRASGGQAVVQFATNKRTREECAVKFFLCKDAFREELQQYADADSPLRTFLPQCRGIYDNADGSVVDGHGRPLPPCIVMEKGESLDKCNKRNNRDMDQFTCMQIIHHICECLLDLHAAGFVHRDLKPANIMWLPRQNRWTLIDFGCAARIGEQARTGFTLTYAAPEAAQATFRDHQQTIEASTALDAWSVGVLAIELFTGRPVLVPFHEGRENIIARIVGDQQLPWEEEGKAKVLLKRAGRFKGAVLGLLHRDPSKRALVQTFMQQYANIMATTTQQEKPEVHDSFRNVF